MYRDQVLIHQVFIHHGLRDYGDYGLVKRFRLGGATRSLLALYQVACRSTTLYVIDRFGLSASSCQRRLRASGHKHVP
jgi:hypothetical protein